MHSTQLGVVVTRVQANHVLDPLKLGTCRLFFPEKKLEVQ